jgi:hypothetical protein
MGSETIYLSEVKNGADAHVQNNVVQDGEDDAQHAGQVEAKYMGTVTDQREMSVLGRTQVLRVRTPQTESAPTHLMTACRGTFDSSPFSALDAL